MTGTMIRRGILAAAVAAIATGTASAGIVNGSFETGDFTGWTTNPGYLASVTTSYTHPSTSSSYSATDGNSFALLSAGNGAGVYTMLSQSFSAAAGDTICGDFFFAANDYMPFNDNAYVRLIDGSTNTELAVLISSSVAAVGNYGETPWTGFSYTLASSFTNLIIEVGVNNVLDNGLSSVCGVDNIQLCSSVVVPLPPAAGLAGLGLLGLAGVKVVRRRK